ncbi:NUDIX domain-containing protein [Chitinophaga pollutisoli]|uniref:NUDIX domain-containing protein n=1 Tax=Chitinophaga pollutisoli TaxID=3133966 RepID=A0ABZ2YLA6_9BACT
METPIHIYINERPLIIAGLQTSLQPEFTGATTLFSPSAAEVAQTIALLEKNQLPAVVFRTGEPETLLDLVKSHFTVLVAAGGLVTNEAGDILLMFRRGKWDLPKGKQDDGETLEACALREVQEETGLKNVTLGRLITETFHYYSLKDKHILKHSYWYRMHFFGTELTIPQIEEDIMDIQWIKPEHIAKYMPYSYQNIVDVLTKAGYAAHA